MKVAFHKNQSEKERHCKFLMSSLLMIPWPSYLRLNIVQNVRCLRSSNVIRLVTPIETGTFQDTFAKLFNELPISIRQCQEPIAPDNAKIFLHLLDCLKDTLPLKGHSELDERS